jgi:hypothetical protein
MHSKAFSSGKIRSVTYDVKTRQLELTWDNKEIHAYRPVPKEVFDRLCSAPNPATYFEDRIAEEYPKVAPAKKVDDSEARRKLNDLFGG